ALSNRVSLSPLLTVLTAGAMLGTPAPAVADPKLQHAQTWETTMFSRRPAILFLALLVVAIGATFAGLSLGHGTTQAGQAPVKKNATPTPKSVPCGPPNKPPHDCSKTNTPTATPTPTITHTPTPTNTTTDTPTTTHTATDTAT